MQPAETSTELLSDASAAPDQAWPAPRHAWYALFVLMIVLILSVIDRQIITLLVDPIKSDLGISDINMSYLMGFAFVAFYIIVGIPIARISDSRSRRFIIGIGVAVWSLGTATCGLAKTGWQLAAARIGVGTGEACNGPASFSLLSDYFPPRRLPRAMAIISMGYYVGVAVANMVGARVFAFASRWPQVQVPMAGSIKPWQLTFILVGLPGLAIAALMGTVGEPPRRGVVLRSMQSQKTAALPLKDVLGFLSAQRGFYGTTFVGLALRFLITVGIASWVPSFLTRTFHWTVVDAGYAIGAVQLIASPLGLLAGGFLAEWLDRRGYADANMRVNLISTAAMIPTYVLFPLMPRASLSLAVLAVNTFLASLAPGPTNAALQMVTPNSMRAQITSMYLIIFNLIGGGIGPFLVAFTTDYIFRSAAGVRYSIALDSAILGPLACLIFAYGLRFYRQSIAMMGASAQTEG